MGSGQTGAHLPASIPSSVRPAIEQVAAKTFYEAYIPAKRTTLILPLVVLALAVMGALLVRRAQTRSEDADAVIGPSLLASVV